MKFVFKLIAELLSHCPDNYRGGKASANGKPGDLPAVQKLFRLSGERPECTDNFVALYFTGFAPVAQFNQ